MNNIIINRMTVVISIINVSITIAITIIIVIICISCIMIISVVIVAARLEEINAHNREYLAGRRSKNM